MPLKVGLVCPYGWNRAGGVREHVRELAVHLARQGHYVSILAPAITSEDVLPEGHMYNMGWNFPFSMNGTTIDITLDPALPQRVHQVFELEAFDIVHIHEPLLPGLSLTALWASKAVTIGTFHAYPFDEVLSVPSLAYISTARLLRPSFCRLDGCIAVSSVASRFISRFFPADYRVIPNGIDLERFHPLVAPLPHLMDGKHNILFVGRFDRRKGARYLLEAIPFIRVQHPDTRFLFVGEGPLRPNLQAYAERERWPDVVFTRYAPAEVLPRYFASAHVFCAPATGGESMGIVLLEAMASGVPIVAANIPGYATVVESGIDGLLTTPCNSQELAQAIIHLLDHQPLCQQFIMMGLQKVRDYAWPQVAQRIIEYYVQLVQERDTCSRFVIPSS